MKNFFLISEENSEEMYEDVYKTKSNYSKIEWVCLFLGLVANSENQSLNNKPLTLHPTIFREGFIESGEEPL